MTQERTKLWYLRNLQICAQFGEAGHKLIHDNSEMKDIRKGEVLYFQGSADRNIYMLKTGTVKISKLSQQGKEIIVDIVKSDGRIDYEGKNIVVTDVERLKGLAR